MVGCAVGAAGGYLAGDTYVADQQNRNDKANESSSDCPANAGDTNPDLVDAAGKVADGMANVGKYGIQAATAVALTMAGGKVGGLVGIGCGAVGAAIGMQFGTGNLSRSIGAIQGINLELGGGG